MGKDLKGKEIGAGIVQQPNGTYFARFVDKFGKRRTKRSKKLQEVKQWLADATYATRCIEGGMKPKTLQKILGHSNIGITMNLYVHITEDEKHREIDLVADALKVV